MNIVILISANAEWQAVKSHLPGAQIAHSPFGESFNLILDHTAQLSGSHLTPETSHLKLGTFRLTFFHSGWGKISSGAMMQYVIDHCSPDLVVNLGTCGGFEGCVNQGDVILVENTFVYDILELMEDDIPPFYDSTLDLSWLAQPYPYPARRGTLASADSDLLPEKIPFLKSKGAIAADWESAALTWVAQRNNVRLLILREVSDVVGEQGSDAYNNYEVFKARTRDIMQQLLDQLPGWLEAVKPFPLPAHRPDLNN